MELGTQELALGFGIALGVGVLVGLERERSAHDLKRPRFGGIRTFPLIAMLGSLSGLYLEPVGPAALAVPFLACAALLGLAYMKEAASSEDPGIGLTTEFAALVVFGLGALPFVGIAGLSFHYRLVLAGGLGAVVMAALSMRDPLHRLAEKMNREDLIATVRFTLLAAVALPLLPDRAWDPWNALNPFKIGLFVVLIAGVSFFGYVAVRILGPRRGIGVTGAAGGLVSSTAVTLSFSGRAKRQPELARMCALAIVLASTIMFPRIMLLVGVVRGDLLVAALPALLAMLVAAAAGGGVLWWRVGRTVAAGEETADDPPHLENPFSLGQALRLGVLFALIRLLAAVLNEAFGTGGLFASATLAGLVDVDPIVISVTRMFASETVARGDAVLAITLAALTNTLVKVGMVFVLGGRRPGILVASVLVPAVAIGVLAAAIL